MFVNHRQMFSIAHLYSVMQIIQASVGKGTCPHQVLTATLTLFQPGEGQIMPAIYCCPHQVLKATGLPEY